MSNGTVFLKMKYSKVKYLLIFIGLITILSAKGQSGMKVIGMGNSDGITTTSSDSGSDPINTLNRSGFLPNHNAAAKLTAQSTFGANFQIIEDIATMGLEDWLDAQLALPVGPSVLDQVITYHEFRKVGEGNPDAGTSMIFWDYAWWQYHMTQQDYLRQRVAFALSEILVISRNSGFGNHPYAFADYYDILLRNAFGNYRDLLNEVTYHATMGEYLTYKSNPKTDTSENRFPDENYAREIMQLFTIGLFELNPDGSRKVDGMGDPISTYDNYDISEFSKVFTGLMWGDRPLQLNQFFKGPLNRESYIVDMQMLNEMHEPGPKELLNGQMIPDRVPVDGDADIQDALDNLFNHPNVGPFIGKLLIQRLVTSNPSPEYIARVSAAFDDNGSGVRGDMKSVIRAIIVDEEARDCAAVNNAEFGMLREPFVRYVQLSKAFNLSTDSGNFRNAMYDINDQINQKPFTSPSVFNFFQPDHQPIGPIADADLVAPEFQLINSQTIIGYLNGLNDWIVRDRPTDEWNLYSGETVPENEKAYFQLSDEIAIATDDRLHELTDRLNLILAQGRLSERSMNLIADALREFPQEDPEDLDERVRIAIYLVMSAPEFLINR